MNERFLAVCLFGTAWLAVDIAGAAVFSGARRRIRARAAAAAAAASLFLAAVLASAGADLWAAP